jgi:phytoene/squalene synthetase
MKLPYRASQVKQYDHDRYICCLFSPEIVQEKLFSILSFNIEIATISEQTSDLTPALIRITWWQDAIDNLYKGQVHQHSLVKALNEIILDNKIPKDLITELLKARMLELHQQPLKSMEELIYFAKGTGSNLLEILGFILDAKAPEFYRPLGIAWSLLGILRSAKYSKSLNKILLFPQDLMPNNFKLGDHNTKTIVQLIVNIIEENLSIIDPKQFSKSTASVDLLYYLSKYYLKLIIKNDYNILCNNLSINPVIKQLYLLYRYLLLK